MKIYSRTLFKKMRTPMTDQNYKKGECCCCPNLKLKSEIYQKLSISKVLLKK